MFEKKIFFINFLFLKLYTLVGAKMEQMQQHNFSWIETQFLKKAVDILSKCRRALMYTYVFAYYLNTSNMSEIFEANQSDLELATEQLSAFLERNLETENLVTLKQRVGGLLSLKKNSFCNF